MSRGASLLLLAAAAASTTAAAAASTTASAGTVAPPWSAVVRIEAAAVDPTYLRPWEKSGQQKKGGTGFVVEGRRILTNHHVIENAVDIRLSKQGSSKRWRARVAASGPDVDLATLEVLEDADGFFADLAPVTWAEELPSLQSRVTVRGYPLGGSAQSVTEGVVSRIDCKNYRLGATSAVSPGNSLVIQIDAAINGGNSGGPAFDASNRVVGVAFQGIDGAQSIGYLIPASLAKTYLDATRGGGGAASFRLVDVPFRVQHLENKGLRRYLKVPDGTSGVVVTAVSPLSALAQPATASAKSTAAASTTGNSSEHKALQPPPLQRQRAFSRLPLGGTATTTTAAMLAGANGTTAAATGAKATSRAVLLKDDVITAIDGHAIGDDGSVALRPGERVGADYLITSKVAGALTELRVLRDGVPLTLHASLGPLPPPLPRWHGFDAAPEWVVIGGLVFAPLTAPLIEDAASASGGVPSFVHDTYTSEVWRGKSGFRADATREPVVLLSVLSGGDVNHGYEEHGWKVLSSFNGEPVASLAGLYRAWRRAESTDFLEFGFGGAPGGAGAAAERKIVLDGALVRESEELLLSLHGIPARASPGVLAAAAEGLAPEMKAGLEETRAETLAATLAQTIESAKRESAKRESAKLEEEEEEPRHAEGAEGAGAAERWAKLSVLLEAKARAKAAIEAAAEVGANRP